MSYQTKCIIAVVIALTGALLILAGLRELQGSLGVSGLVRGGAIKLAIGFLLFATGAPATVYYRAQSKAKKNATQQEIDILFPPDQRRK